MCIEELKPEYHDNQGALGVSGPAQPVAPLRLSKPGKPELGGSPKPRNNKTRSQLYLAYNLQCVPASGFFFYFNFYKRPIDKLKVHRVIIL